MVCLLAAPRICAGIAWMTAYAHCTAGLYPVLEMIQIKRYYKSGFKLLGVIYDYNLNLERF